MPLMDILEAQKECWGGCGGVRPLTFPKQSGGVVGLGEDGLLL